MPMPLNLDVKHVSIHCDRGSGSAKQNGERICRICSNFVLTLIVWIFFQLHVSSILSETATLQLLTLNNHHVLGFLHNVVAHGGTCVRFPFLR